jgi:hypothetical protein
MRLQLLMKNGSNFGAINSTAIGASSSYCTPNLLVLATLASQFPTGHNFDLRSNLLDLPFSLNLFPTSPTMYNQSQQKIAVASARDRTPLDRIDSNSQSSTPFGRTYRTNCNSQVGEYLYFMILLLVYALLITYLYSLPLIILHINLRTRWPVFTHPSWEQHQHHSANPRRG